MENFNNSEYGSNKQPNKSRVDWMKIIEVVVQTALVIVHTYSIFNH